MTSPSAVPESRWLHGLSRGGPFVLAAAMACSATLRFGPGSLRGSSLSWAVMGVLALALAWPTRWLVHRVLVPWLRPYSGKGRSAWCAGALAGALFLCVTIPVTPYRPPRQVQLEVTATGEKSSASQGAEIWIQGLVSRSDGQRVSLEAERLSGEWTDVEGALKSGGNPPATLRWAGYLDEDAELVLTQHAWSGLARITLNGETQQVDLFSATPGQWVLPVRGSVAITAFTEGWLQRRLSRLSEILCIALMLLTAGLGLVAWPGSAPGTAEEGRWSWLAPSAVCMTVWGVFLLALWPGLLSYDSIVQWTQLTTGQLSNAHPAFHTMMMWLVSRVWYSPAAVALCQVVALALVFGLTLRELGRWGVPVWARWGVTVLFALSPVNTALSITLWKDVAYSITLLALSSMLLTLARTRGEVLRSKAFLGGLTALLTLSMLLRHNGIPVSLLLLGLLGVIVPRALRLRVGLVAAVCVGSFVLISGPIYRAMNVASVPRVFAYSHVFHQLGAFIHAAPDSLTSEERATLESMQPLRIWRDDYNAFVVNPLIFNDRLNWNAFDESPEPGRALVRVWWRLLPEHLPTLFEHQLRVTSLVWRIRPEPGGYSYLYQFDVPANDMGLKRDTRWPGAERALMRWLNYTAEGPRLVWFWRPALLLYLSLFCAVIAVVRLRQGWVVLGILPAVINSAVLMGLMVAQDFRYQYPMHIAGLVSLLLVFVRREPRAVPVTVATPEAPAPVVAAA